jgi:hypothetical protein
MMTRMPGAVVEGSDAEKVLVSLRNELRHCWAAGQADLPPCNVKVWSSNARGSTFVGCTKAHLGQEALTRKLILQGRATTEAGGSNLTAALQAKVNFLQLSFQSPQLILNDFQMDMIDMCSKERKEVSYMAETIDWLMNLECHSEEVVMVVWR